MPKASLNCGFLTSVRNDSGKRGVPQSGLFSSFLRKQSLPWTRSGESMLIGTRRRKTFRMSPFYEEINVEFISAPSIFPLTLGFPMLLQGRLLIGRFHRGTSRLF
jgi:hypothetical protein